MPGAAGSTTAGPGSTCPSSGPRAISTAGFLEAVGYFAPGPWQGIDPFRPFKLAELDTPEADEELAALDDLAHRPAEDQEEALLHGSLWGNRADLGFSLSGTRGGTAAESQLVADDADVLRSLLMRRHPLSGRGQRGPGTHPRPPPRRPPAPARPGRAGHPAGEAVPVLRLRRHARRRTRRPAPPDRGEGSGERGREPPLGRPVRGPSDRPCPPLRLCPAAVHRPARRSPAGVRRGRRDPSQGRPELPPSHR